ncbi:MAG: TerB family tellurite resistance protein [Ahrensia sp.]|nr:TerB family tellurite resistance protein [Ahrensia sp.]
MRDELEHDAAAQPVGGVMFEKVMSWLQSSDRDHTDEDVKVAVAALYYHMMVVDGLLLRSEVEKYEELLTSRFNLSEAQLEALSRQAIDAESGSVSLFPFTVILKRDLDAEQQRQVLHALQELADADGVRHEAEMHMIDDVADLLEA